MQDLQSILDGLQDKELDFVFERSKTTSDAQALKAAGIPQSTFYGWSEERRELLQDCAQKLKRRARMRALLVLEEASEEAAKKIIELMGSRNPNVALNAAKDVLDRTAGRAVQRQEIAGKDGGDIVIRWANELENDNTPETA